MWGSLGHSKELRGNTKALRSPRSDLPGTAARIEESKEGYKEGCYRMGVSELEGTLLGVTMNK